MNIDTLLLALDLPIASRVDQRVPKKLLLENGAPTAADKRHINGEIEELIWLAALKPMTIGVPEHRDATREYLEIAVLRLTLRVDEHPLRLVELVHRAIPYPVVLLTQDYGGTQISAAHKRWAQNENEKVVLDGAITSVAWDDEQQVKHDGTFLRALPVFKQPRASLYLLYQGWIDTMQAMQAARVTDDFRLASDASQASARRDALEESAQLDREILRLRAAARKEKQMARLVELNLQLKRAEAAKSAARAKL